ncbi:MAG: hypothetical protein K2K45_00465 [Muribaculaceae bacterium]|nr:hypothetical protein [Muribaculaceae bacterium]
MRKSLSLICFLMAFIHCPAGADAARKHTRGSDEKPIITIKSDAYNVIGPANSFGIILGSTETDYFDIDAGFGLQEMEVEPWTIEDGAISGTYKTLQVSEEGVIRVYGDPEKIDMVQLQGGYVTEIEMSQCVNLEVLDLSHNTLKALDLTPFTNLYAIYLSDNPFTKETPLKVGAPKNRLAILEIDIVDHLDQSFNLSDYPAIQAFDAYHNLDLWNIDPTGCPELLTMSLELTNVSTLDVSKNPKLISLNISETRITDIDLSNNPGISTLMAEHASGWVNTSYHLNGIDLTTLPNLAVLYLGGNRLQNIDLSKNPKLTNLNLRRNNLTSLDLSGNPDLYSVTITHNDMDFATLPAPEETWGEYFYLQNDIRVSKSIEVNSTLDLSSRVLRQGTETSATVWVKAINGNDTILDPSLYSYADGIISFNKAVPDSIYVKYENSLFPEYQLSTTPFMVKSSAEMGKPSPMISITPGETAFETLSAYVGLSGASEESPVKFLVDFGDGVKHEFHAVSFGLPESPNISGRATPGKAVTIYVPEEESVTAFGIADFQIADINVTQAHDLRVININNAGMKDIDLRYNRCLESLNLDNNDLTELDLEGLFANWEKNVLHDLSAAGNKLTNANITVRTPVRNLNLRGNQLSNLSLKDFDNMKTLDLSDNRFSGEMNLAYLIEADTIILSGNRLNRIVYDTFTNLSLLDISDNFFDLETLPYQPGASQYIYVPQKPIELLPNAPAINLTSQNRVLVDGEGTTFTWKRADGFPLTEGIDMNCTDGATRFLKDDLGKVYCELTNPAFPEFNGNNVLRTTEVNVVGVPTVVVASFTTLEDSESGELIIASDKNTSIYVDWRGDGSEFIPYAATKEDYYNPYDSIRTYKNANVKIYTYDEATDLTVFSVYGMKMGEFDGTPMTGLTMIGINDSELDIEDIKLPDAPLTNLKLSGNNLSEFIWFEKYPHLQSLDLAGNRFETFDASPLKDLKTLYLGGNSLTEVKFDNIRIWELDLENNNLETVDLTGLKALEQLWIGGNKLSDINVIPYRATLHAMDLTNNRFSFATLPVQTDYPNLTVYYYSNQQMLDAVISDDFMTYDLSSQALVKDIYATSYTWFLGEPVFDSETGTLSGEVLIEDDEYTISGGVTTFNTRFPDDVVCVMTNSLFPKTYMRTPAYRVGYGADVEGIDAENCDAKVDVYSLSGAILKRQVHKCEALDHLPSGIYIVEGKKVFLK